MEELQDAIEDAQYVNAISTHEGPRPMIAWDTPSENELSEWKKSKIDNTDNYGEAFSPEWFMAQPIGFFLFAQFVKNTFCDYNRLNFIEDVIRFRQANPRYRSDKAKKMANYYLVPKREGDVLRNKEIEDDDIARGKTSISKEQIEILMKTNKINCFSVSAIGVDGPLLEEAKQHSARMILSNNNNSQTVPEREIFDGLEAIVFESLRIKYWDEFLLSKEYERCINFLWFQDRAVVEEDFYILRVLGRGGFGLVTGCRKGTSGKLYAMKVMNKKRIKIKKSETLTLSERMVLKSVNSPFVVNLKYSFQSKNELFLILDLMTGGDLSFHLGQKGYFPKEDCMYYGARIMLGLQALHDKQFVYRDLKPENCLLDESGRMKLTDLGLACRITPDLHGAAGTRGYWAPEMLRRDENGRRMPYGHTVDWFSFGCLLAELICGFNPFRSEMALSFGLERIKALNLTFDNEKKKKEKAIDLATLEMEPKFESSKFDPDSRDLCRKLLNKDEKKRLGYKGCEEIMSHPWFKGMDWEMIMSDKMKPPFIPSNDVNALSQRDIGQFAEDKVFQETALTENDELRYQRWNWTNPVAYSAEVIEFLICERELGAPLLPVKGADSCCCTIS